MENDDYMSQCPFFLNDRQVTITPKAVAAESSSSKTPATLEITVMMVAVLPVPIELNRE